MLKLSWFCYFLLQVSLRASRDTFFNFSPKSALDLSFLRKRFSYSLCKFVSFISTDKKHENLFHFSRIHSSITKGVLVELIIQLTHRNAIVGVVASSPSVIDCSGTWVFWMAMWITFSRKHSRSYKIMIIIEYANAHVCPDCSLIVVFSLVGHFLVFNLLILYTKKDKPLI